MWSFVIIGMVSLVRNWRMGIRGNGRSIFCWLDWQSQQGNCSGRTKRLKERLRVVRVTILAMNKQACGSGAMISHSGSSIPWLEEKRRCTQSFTRSIWFQCEYAHEIWSSTRPGMDRHIDSRRVCLQSAALFILDTGERGIQFPWLTLSPKLNVVCSSQSRYLHTGAKKEPDYCCNGWLEQAPVEHWDVLNFTETRFLDGKSLEIFMDLMLQTW